MISETNSRVSNVRHYFYKQQNKYTLLNKKNLQQAVLLPITSYYDLVSIPKGPVVRYRWNMLANGAKFKILNNKNGPFSLIRLLPFHE